MSFQFPHCISSVKKLGSIILGIIMSKDVTSLLAMWYLFADINLFSKVSFFFRKNYTFIDSFFGNKMTLLQKWRSLFSAPKKQISDFQQNN